MQDFHRRGSFYLGKSRPKPKGGGGLFGIMCTFFTVPYRAFSPRGGQPPSG